MGCARVPVAALSWFLPDRAMLLTVFLAPAAQKLPLARIKPNGGRGRGRKRDQRAQWLACLPARARRMKVLLTGGACGNQCKLRCQAIRWYSKCYGKKNWQNKNEASRAKWAQTRQSLTFDSQSCRSCETTRFSKPCRLIRMSSMLEGKETRKWYINSGECHAWKISFLKVFFFFSGAEKPIQEE